MNSVPVETAAVVKTIPAMRSLPGHDAHGPGASARAAPRAFDLTAVPAVVLLSVLCARFRDMQQIVGNVVQLSFFLTPIFWHAGLLKQHRYFVEWNPFHWALEVIRAPIVDVVPSWEVYAKLGGLAVLLYAVAIPVFLRYRRRLAFWV